MRALVQRVTEAWVDVPTDTSDRSPDGIGTDPGRRTVVGRIGPGLLVLENTFHAKGGPARHLHVAQDEWFYAVEGEFVLEVGSDRHRLGPGDSLLAPRGVPHVWAHVGDGRGRILIAFAPAGQMEAFFRVVTARDAMPPQDPAPGMAQASFFCN